MLSIFYLQVDFYLYEGRFLIVFYQTEFKLIVSTNNVEFLISGRRDVKFGYIKFADFFDNDRQTFDQPFGSLKIGRIGM